jgi:hypothetical protein
MGGDHHFFCLPQNPFNGRKRAIDPVTFSDFPRFDRDIEIDSQKSNLVPQIKLINFAYHKDPVFCFLLRPIAGTFD